MVNNGSLKFESKISASDLVTLGVGTVAVLVPTVLWFRERADRKAAEDDAVRVRDSAAIRELAEQANRFHVWLEVAGSHHLLARYYLQLSNRSEAPVRQVRVDFCGPGTNAFEGQDSTVFYESDQILPSASGAPERIDVTDRLLRGFEASPVDQQVCRVGRLSFEDAAGMTWERDEKQELWLSGPSGRRSVRGIIESALGVRRSV